MSDEAKASSTSDTAPAPGTPAPASQLGKRAPRSAARIAAVQALFQMDLAGTDIADVINEFKTTRFAAANEPEPVKNADPAFFTELVHGVVRRQRDIDPMIDARLAQGWRLNRLDRTLRAILRSAVFELVERSDVPARVVINEYINIAHAFFDGDEPKVVNGVLDALSRDSRSHELKGPRTNTNTNTDTGTEENDG